MEDKLEIKVIEAIVAADSLGMQDFAVELLRMYGDKQSTDEVLSLIESRSIKS